MCNRRHRGIALITAIWILALLLVLVGGFSALVHSEIQVARNFGSLARARWAAHAGIRRAEVTVLDAVAQPYTDLGGVALTIDSADEQPPTVEEATYRTVITDEAGKINLNTASVEVLRALFPTEVADAILDWRDADDHPEPEGAEDDYYLSLASPYHCKNQPFDTVGELLQVKGVTHELLDTAITQDGPTLEEVLTVYSQDNNTDASGSERLNITTATKEQLTVAFGDVLLAAEIDAIIKQRSTAAFTTPANLLQVPGLSREKVGLIYDRVTTSTKKVLPGLVNINTAPAEVLAVLPGMDEALAQALVQYREAQGPFSDVGKLLAVEAFDTAAFLRVGDLLTTRSRYFHAVATGQCSDGTTQAVTSVLQVETTENGPITRTCYWHE